MKTEITAVAFVRVSIDIQKYYCINLSILRLGYWGGGEFYIVFVLQDVSKYLVGEDAIDLILEVILKAKSLRKLVRLILLYFF